MDFRKYLAEFIGTLILVTLAAAPWLALMPS